MFYDLWRVAFISLLLTTPVSLGYVTLECKSITFPYLIVLSIKVKM